MNLTYNKAYNDLSKLVDQIEDDKIQLDNLADKVKQAKELIDFCEAKLRTIDKDVKAALTDKKPTTRKKNRL
ncbi:MAG: exodeoxyribonuclease VII small subunit [Bacteroidetes bacterium]|jgi:exodeoxyribonuclease VII small subunit|nr:exodeoxyribonuclease VII small subunit [Bacteroidota bacterium]MBS1980348.1 exodeoxyribonuclease VII small subunit [Bacteroidota bacterium]